MSGRTPKLNITSLHSIYLPVRDSRRSADWYKRHFGLEEIKSSDGQVTVRLEEGASLVLMRSNSLNVYECNPFHFKCNDARKAHSALDKCEVQASER